LFLDEMRKINGQEVEYGTSVRQVKIDENAVHNSDAYCVTAVVDRNGKDHTYKARYVIVSNIR
jgi:phenol 2-monooxygenase